MWIVKKCETGHRQCVSVRQSVRQSLHPIRYIFHAVSQATGSLSVSLPYSPSLTLLLCESLHLAWLLASFSNAAGRQQRTKYQVEFSFSASSSTWFTFVPWQQQQQQQLEYYYNNSNNCGNNSWQSIIARVSFRLSSKFFGFYFCFLIMPQLDWTNQSV